MYEYKAKITRVVDGDTVSAELNLGFNIKIKERFRILNIDTPETWRPSTEAERAHGKEATARAKELLEGKTLTLHTGKHGKYRWLASIDLEDGQDFATVMVNEGFQKKDHYEEDQL